MIVFCLFKKKDFLRGSEYSKRKLQVAVRGEILNFDGQKIHTSRKVCPKPTLQVAKSTLQMAKNGKSGRLAYSLLHGIA